jgi:phosphodiesterase/alkaline phosphatase D-like protein
VRANQEVNYKVAYVPAAGGTEQEVDYGTLDDADDYTGSVALTGLSPDTAYEYRVLLAGVEHHAGTFRTLPAAGEPGEIVFAYGADLSVAHRPFEAALAVENDQPHFLILGGDNMYADSFLTVPDNKAAYEARYRQTFGDEHLQSCMSAVPTFMTWDDHEISNDWYPGKNARYPNARAAFDEYQGSHNPDPLTPGELYYSFTAGEADFFVLDTRTHRSPNAAADGPLKTMLGATQRDALLDFLDNSSAKFKFIVSSVPFNVWATTSDDAWESYLTERDAILSHVRDNAIPGVVLLSGDQHWAGVFRLAHLSPYPFYEFMPTPMGTSNRTQTSSTDSQILYKNDDYVGYGRFTINTAMTPATLTFEWVDSGGIVRHSMTIDEDDIVP